MDTASAFLAGEANRNKELMVFDWDKAAQLIIQHGAKEASAGLQYDWEWTGGDIFLDGKVVLHDYTYLASTWATPELVLDDGETFDCYKMQSETDQWGADTKWPDSALEILKRNK